ncbi:hypothetical protein HJFPF1_03442 [Paramyrothecium foliicola]|nr:hypothetical protein HJFPF1_03442 [Paramyrothecium foliicola]
MPTPTNGNDVEPFPVLESAHPPYSEPHAHGATHPDGGHPVNRAAASSSISSRIRGLSGGLEHSNPPEGFMAATSDIASSIIELPVTGARPAAQADAPTTSTIRHESHAIGSPPGSEKNPGDADAASSQSVTVTRSADEKPGTAPFANGYHFPPKHTFAHSTKLGATAFWKYFTTPMGFCVTIYGLNVVAWGGMLFLLLCNASPAMCYPTCNDINSPRRKWIEWDSQILNALFCVTGFGLAPWRFRDLYYLLQYRILGKEVGLRRLAGINRGWFRLPGSTELPVELGPETIDSTPNRPDPMTIPFPEKMIPDAPLTGTRARATKVWKLDVVIWLMVWNTFFQACLAGFMWAMNRYTRPSWATGLFIALAFGVAGVAGIMMFIEGKAVKAVEGVPISDEDLERLRSDGEQGIWHYNNIKDRELKEKEKAKKEKGEKAEKGSK